MLESDIEAKIYLIFSAISTFQQQKNYKVGEICVVDTRYLRFI